jgi:transposase InsO family protein
MALASGRRPEIFHSDQGCQFTSADYVAKLQAEDIKISWSSRRRCYDNILVESLGVRSSMRRFISVPTAVAGMRKLAWLDSYGGMAM